MPLTAEQMEALVAQFETDAGLLNDVVHGPIATTVDLGGGVTTPTLTEAIDSIVASDPTLIVENGYLDSTVPLVFKRTFIVDWDDRLGGGSAVYVPTAGFMGNATTGVIEDVSLTAFADTKYTGHVKVPIAISEFQQTIYYDIDDAVEPIKVATYPTLMPRDAIRYRPLMILYGVDGSVWSPYKWEITRDQSRTSLIVNGNGIWFDKTANLLLIPRIYGWTNTGGWSLLPPTDEVFREVDISTYMASSSLTFVWIDVMDILQNGGESETALKFTTGYNTTTNMRPNREGGYLVLLGAIFQKGFHALNPDVEMAQMAVNEFGCGREDNDLAERYYSDSEPADLTRDESLALGFTRGWTSLVNGGAFYGGLFRQAINGGRTLIVRYFIETDVENDFGTEPRNYLFLRNEDGSITNDSFPSTLKKKHTNHLAEYYDVIRFTNGQTYEGLWAGTFGVQPGGDKRVFGLQFGFSDRFPSLSLTDYPRQRDEMGARMRALEAVFPSIGNVFDPILPAKLYVHPTRPYRIYLDQVFGPFAHGRYRATVASNPSGLGPTFVNEYLGGGIELSPTRISDITDFCFTDLKGLQSEKIRFEVATKILDPADIDLLNVSILTIGDSLNNYTGCGVQTIKRLRDMGATVTSIGTMNMTSEVPEDGSDSELGEARGGREFADYIYKDTDRMSPVAPGDEATYLGYSNTTKREWNPFLKTPTVDDIADKADMIFNDWIFDMRFYLDRFSLADPDAVVINLHTNDISHEEPATSLLNIQTGLAVMVPQIREALPSTKIILVYNSYGRVSNEVRWEGEHWDGLKAFIEFLRNLADSNVILAPAYCTVQRDAGFSYTSTLNTETGAYTDRIEDATHYAENGIKEHAEMLAQFVAGILTGA